MHLHTINNSHCGQEEPADIARIYAEAGYNGIVVTNHFNRTDLFGYDAQQYGSRLNVDDCRTAAQRIRKDRYG